MASLHRPRLALAGLGTIFAINGAVSAGLSPRYAELASALNLSAGELGAALAAGTVGAAVGAVLMALGLARRLTRPWLALALMIYAASPIMVAASTSAAGLLLARMAKGMTNGPVDVGQLALAGYLSVQMGRTLLPRLELIYTAGSLLGAYAAGATIGHLPLRPYLLAAGLLALVAALLVIPTLPQIPRGETDRHLQARGAERPYLLGTLAMLALLMETLPLDWGALLFATTLHAPPSQTGWGVIAVQVGAVAGLLASSPIAHRIGPTRTLRYAALVALLGGLLVAAAPSPVPATAALGLIGFGSGPALPMVLSLVHDAQSIARLTVVMYLGPLVSRSLGVVGDAVGLRWVIAVVVPAALTVMVLASLLLAADRSDPLA